MDGASISMIIAIVCLIIASAFFSATETAYSSLNKIRLKNRAEDGEKNAELALRLADDYDRLLSTILIGNNIVNISAASVGTVLFTKWLLGYGPTVSTIVITVVVLVFSEVSPKTLAKSRPETFAIKVAPLMALIVKVLIPLTFFFRQWQKMLSKVFRTEEDDSITEEELISMVSEAENEGGLDEHEGELIRAAIGFNDLEVDEILTPRVDVEAVEDDVTTEELGKRFAETGYSRIPVYHDTIDNIIGVIHEKDFYIARFQGKTDPTKLITPVVYTTVSAKVAELLRTLQVSKNHMAVVVDEYGGTAGIVTLEDILEELVGDIWDEHDEVVEEFQKQSDGSYLINCAAGLDDMYNLFDLKEDEESDSATVSGWVMEQIGRLPKAGDHFVKDGLDVTVVKVFRRRVLQIRVIVLEEEEEN